MTDTFPTFEQFLLASTGHEPYLWQAELAQRLLDGHTPGAIDVPTGMGKTTILHAWLWALARQRATGTRRTVATRLHLVVDRRLLVDSTAEQAMVLAEQLRGATGGPLREIADSLRELSARDGTLLAVRSLRGGQVNSEHVRDPKLPAVITSTVDMLGSRLLWRGYGVSRSRRPIDAALAGADSLVVLDEAHLSPQFVRLLDDLALEQQHLETGFGTVPPMRSIIMSATQQATEREVLRADVVAECAVNEFLAGRRSRRDAVRIDFEPGTDLAVASSDLSEIISPSHGEAHVVFVNSVAMAVNLSKRLTKTLKDSDTDVVTILGGMPSAVREQALVQLAPFQTGADRDAPGLVVVATQSLEVGADLDFDRGWSQMAPTASLVQRLGRVNRVGAREGGSFTIVADGQRESVYKQCLPAVGAWLERTCPTTVAGFTAAIEAHDEDDLNTEPSQLITALSHADFCELVDTENDVSDLEIHRLLRLQEPDWSTQVVFRDHLDELVATGAQAVETWLAAARAPRAEQWSVGPSVLKTIKAGKGHPPIPAVIIGRDNSIEIAADFGQLMADGPWLAGCTIYLGSREQLADRYVTGFGEDLSSVSGVGAQLLVHAPVVDWDDDGAKVLERRGLGGHLVTDLSDTLALVVARTSMTAEAASRVSLAHHNREVGQRAGAWARLLGMDDGVVAAIAWAGAHHDDGKDHPGFQFQLELSATRNGRRPVHVPNEDLLAKSDLPAHLHRAAAAMAFANGLPRHFRHEARSCDLLEVPDSLDADLVRYLVATHHGHFRHLGLPGRDCSPMQDVTSPVWGSWPGVGGRLRAIHGPYTLALAEAVLRLTDWECSAAAYTKEEA